MKKKRRKKDIVAFIGQVYQAVRLKRFKLLILNIQFAYQRIRYGFCESDVMGNKSVVLERCSCYAG